MALELVNGYWGIEHVTAEQEADFIAGLLGSGAHVLPIGEQMRAEAVTANKVRIFDGVYVKYGRRCQIEEGAFEDVTIENGTAGLLRNDMIIVRYVKDEATGVEGVSFDVLKGQTGETAADPAPNDQDIRTGVFESELPLYRVRLNGLAIEAIEPLFSVSMSSEDIEDKFTELNTNISYRNADITNLHSKIENPTTAISGRCWGRVCELTVVARLSAGTYTSDDVFGVTSIPPVHTVRIVCRKGSGAELLNVDTSGNIKPNDSIKCEDTSYIIGTCTYIAKKITS